MTDRRITGVEVETATQGTGGQRQVTGAEVEVSTQGTGGERRITATEVEVATQAVGGQRQITAIFVEVAVNSVIPGFPVYGASAGVTILQVKQTDGLWHDVYAVS